MITANDYAEVYEILSYMDKYTVMQVPSEILENIKKNRNKNFNSKIDINDLFNFNNVSNNTKRILAWLDVNYWMDYEKKEKLKKNLIEKKRKIELEKTEKYSINNMFNNTKENNNVNLVLKDEKSIINSIKDKINFILSIFK